MWRLHIFTAAERKNHCCSSPCEMSKPQGGDAEGQKSCRSLLVQTVESKHFLTDSCPFKMYLCKWFSHYQAANLSTLLLQAQLDGSCLKQTAHTTYCSPIMTACQSYIQRWSRPFIWATVCQGNNTHTHGNSPFYPLSQSAPLSPSLPLSLSLPLSPSLPPSAWLSFTGSHHVARSPARIRGAADYKGRSDLKRWSPVEQHFTLQWLHKRLMGSFQWKC